MIRNLRCTVIIDSVLANSKTHNAFLFTVNAIFRHDYPLPIEPGSTPRPLVQKKTWRDSLPVNMLLSAVSVLVVAQSSSEILEGLMNNPVYLFISLLYMSRASVCPSSEENYFIYATLVFVALKGGGFKLQRLLLNKI